VQHQKNNPGAVEPFDPKDAIIDEANRKNQRSAGKSRIFKSKGKGWMSKQASRRRLKATKRLVQEDEIGDTQPMSKKKKALQEAGAQ
jgi:hypothetical protein